MSCFGDDHRHPADADEINDKGGRNLDGEGSVGPVIPVDGDTLLMVEVMSGGAMILAGMAPAVAASLGLTAEAVGQPLAEVALPSMMTQPLMAALQRSVATGWPVAVAVDRDHPEGRRWQVTPLQDQGLQAVRVLCRLEPAIVTYSGREAPDHWFQTVIDAVPVPIFIKSPEGLYIFCNRAFGEFHGRPVSDFVGRSVFEIAPAALAAIYHQADLALLAAIRKGLSVGTRGMPEAHVPQNV